jgi:outer membrane lipoprotein-sorting protein
MEMAERICFPVICHRGAVVLAILLGLALPGAAQDARAIVQRADEKVRGRSSEGEATIQIVRPTWKRELLVHSWTLGNDYSIILIKAPARDKGTAFLKRKKEVWNWAPTIERTIKLPPSMMTQSWMGTDFTNDDLVKESSMVTDYTHRLLGEEAVAGRPCYRIELLPRPEAAVVWGKVLLWIDTQDYLQLRSEFYDEDGQLVNTMHGSDIRLLGGRLLPARLEMIPADKPNQKTVLLYRTLRFDIPITEADFTVQRLRQIR